MLNQNTRFLVILQKPNKMIVKNYKTEIRTNTEIFTGIGYNYFKTLASGRDLVIISDNNLFTLYPDAFENEKYIIIEPGEEHKTLQTVELIIQKLIQFKADRKTLIVGFGGGNVCDVAGFVANIYMRGTNFGFVATTLLAQIDAALGGKNGVNFGGFKNYLGNISQPEFVVCDPTMFKTLKDEDYLSGLGEVLKYAFICEKNLSEYVVANAEGILARDPDVLRLIVKRCIEIKTRIVEVDPTDTGVRHILNFGHTVGHCIEIVDGIPHGIAVAKGIVAAIGISVKLGYSESALIKQGEEIITKLIPDISYKLDERHYDLLINDKKKSGDLINFVFLLNIGEPLIIKVKMSEIIDALKS